MFKDHNFSVLEQKILKLLFSYKNSINDKACGLHTRLISDCCDIDIYRTRYYLLKLERYGLVFRYKDNGGKLIWNVTEN